MRIQTLVLNISGLMGCRHYPGVTNKTEKAVVSFISPHTTETF